MTGCGTYSTQNRAHAENLRATAGPAVVAADPAGLVRHRAGRRLDISLRSPTTRRHHLRRHVHRRRRPRGKHACRARYRRATTGASFCKINFESGGEAFSAQNRSRAADRIRARPSAARCRPVAGDRRAERCRPRGEVLGSAGSVVHRDGDFLRTLGPTCMRRLLSDGFSQRSGRPGAEPAHRSGLWSVSGIDHVPGR